MKKAEKFQSIHPRLNCAANFIADMQDVLAGNEKLSRRQKLALKAIETTILELSPVYLLGCPKAQPTLALLRDPTLRAGSEK